MTRTDSSAPDPAVAAVLVDSGFRRGTDIVKALGADTVRVGRATLFGLAAGGEAGAGYTLSIRPRKSTARWANRDAARSPNSARIF